MNNCNYLILPIAELNNVDYSEVMQTSAETVRKNIAETEFVVKWEGVCPPSIYNIEPIGDEDQKDVKTHSEILTIMAGADWSTPEE